MHGETIKIILSYLNPLIYVKYNLQVFRMCVCGWTTRVFMNVMHVCVCVCACVRARACKILQCYGNKYLHSFTYRIKALSPQQP
jgi:hypothetical protein